jgi:Arm DNA-binding domain
MTQERTMLMNRLTVKEVKNSKKGELSDGGGLYLHTDESNNRKWTFKYTAPGGKRREMGLGVFPDISLADARSAAANARVKVNNGIDPIDQKYQELKLIEKNNRQVYLISQSIEDASMNYFE